MDLFKVDEAGSEANTATADDSPIDEFENFWLGIDKFNSADSKPGAGVRVGDGVKRFGVDGKTTCRFMDL